ncbi:hypothetical protein Misp01_01400 [Microtetraspora sp. NBRC 13810]|uniref:WXG100 family type VII secretion target n=1 Tax=Microtetraspora sp. NBRC 13810 TaxID=3030990 RepID=UPI0024A46C7B|nr:hypothetical protein [Microtetraspora sp. NBRC 13810]GLW05010.1 hypothetical protein Misp01_01400 [Microtetraspora sp. NBRC 13810]
MSEHVKVNFGAMEETQIGLLNVVTAMDKATDDLITQLKVVLGDEAWQGGAAEFFEQHRVKWNAAEAEMGRQLGEAARALGVANENYRAAEARNKAIWATH